MNWASTGGYVDFTVNVPATGYELLDFRYAAASAGSTRTLLIDGTQAAVIALPVTGPYWSVWATADTVSLYLFTPGTHTIRMVRNASDQGLVNLDRLTATTPMYLYDIPSEPGAVGIRQGDQCLHLVTDSQGYRGDPFRMVADWAACDSYALYQGFYRYNGSRHRQSHCPNEPS